MGGCISILWDTKTSNRIFLSCTLMTVLNCNYIFIHCIGEGKELLRLCANLFLIIFFFKFYNLVFGFHIIICKCDVTFEAFTSVKTVIAPLI